jgi:hypothetical protein
MNNETAIRIISAKQAETQVPALDDMVGNDEIRRHFQARLQEPFVGDSNVLIEGKPGTGKTNAILSYLQQRFNDPTFEAGDVFEKRKEQWNIAQSDYDLRFWQTNSGDNKVYAYLRVDGGTDSKGDIEVKLRDARNNHADHTYLVLDEAGELYFRSLEEMFRPILTDPRITVYATAQNFHNKRKTDTSEEAADRLSAFLRRFPNQFHTQNPSETDLVHFLIRRMKSWEVKLDEAATLRLLVRKSGGVVGYALIPIIKAIDNGRMLTRDLVERADIDPNGR